MTLFIAENPTEKYPSFDHHGLQIFTNQEDIDETTLSNAKATCDKHGFKASGGGYCIKQVYYLRGSRAKADHDKVLLGIVESELPTELNEIINCLSFWNQEGEANYSMNRSGQESYNDFILKCIAADCRAFVRPHYERFITGMGGNHVWVAHRATNERILMIHF